MITGTLTLDYPGAKWMGFGDRVIVSLGGQVLIINSGVFHNQDLTDAGQGSSSFHAAGQIIWAPDYWYGLSPGDGYGANKVAAEKCVRSGIRGAYWQANTSYPIGSIVVPSEQKRVIMSIIAAEAHLDRLNLLGHWAPDQQ